MRSQEKLMQQMQEGAENYQGFFKALWDGQEI
jgi:hypothetical protein